MVKSTLRSAPKYRRTNVFGVKTWRGQSNFRLIHNANQSSDRLQLPQALFLIDAIMHSTNGSASQYVGIVWTVARTPSPCLAESVLNRWQDRRQNKSRWRCRKRWEETKMTLLVAVAHRPIHCTKFIYINPYHYDNGWMDSVDLPLFSYIHILFLSFEVHANIRRKTEHTQCHICWRETWTEIESKSIWHSKMGINVAVAAFVQILFYSSTSLRQSTRRDSIRI